MNFLNVIEFPGLGGLQITANPIAFRLFGLNIYWYGIIISLCFLIVALMSMKNSKKFGIKQDDIIDLVLYISPIGIIFARLFYVFVNWSDFKDDLPSIINLRSGGTAIYGGIIAGMVVIYIFAKVKKIKPLKIVDLAALSMPLAQAVGRWGNFINQELYGVNTNLPWGMTSVKIQNELQRNLISLQEVGININPALPVHPTFFYEFVWNLIIFGVVMLWFKKFKKSDGELTCIYLFGYGLGRFLIDGLRTDLLVMGNVKINSLIGLIFAISMIIIFIKIRKKQKDIEIPDEAESIYGKLVKEMKEEAEVEAEEITESMPNKELVDDKEKIEDD
jgi:phosphatidylglycerol:prolipoprotein diacylglycerol transferase